jgi:hypothetical protein
MKQLSDFAVGHLYWDKENFSRFSDCYIFNGTNFLIMSIDDWMDSVEKPMKYEGDINNMVDVDTILALLSSRNLKL